MPFLFVTALAVPLVYSNATIDPVLLPRFLLVAVLGIVVVTVVGVRIVRSSTSLSVNRAEAISLGVLVSYIVAATTSTLIAGWSVDGAFELLKLATFAWLVYASARAIDGKHANLQLLAKFVVVSSLVVGGFAILQYYQIAIFEWMRRDTTVDATMASRNLLAAFLTLAFPFTVYAFLELDARWRVVSVSSMLVSAFLLVALQTRSAWVAFPGGLVFSVLVLAVVTKRAPQLQSVGRHYKARLTQAALAMAVAMSMALLVDSPSSRAPMGERVGSLVQLGHASVRERIQLWSRTAHMIRENPLTGVGLGNWRIALPTYGTEGLRSDTGTLHFQRPHNDFLWVASETGVLGGLLYAAFLASVLGVGASAMVRAPTAQERVALTLMVWGVSSYVLVSLFSFPKERIAHLIYLALLIGTIVSFHRNADGRMAARRLSRRASSVLVGIVWVATAIAGWVAVSRYSAEVHLRRAFEARAVKDWPRMVEHLDRIDNRYYVMDPSSAPIAWYRGVAGFESGDMAAAEGDFRRALEIHPNHVHVLNNLATCRTLQREHDEAIVLYEKAIDIAPRFEEARINLALTLHGVGRHQEAYDVLAPYEGEMSSSRFVQSVRQIKAALGLED